MIDIHTHILFGVDDGAKTIEESILMINDCVKQGVYSFVMSPHFNDLDSINENFHLLKRRVNEPLYLWSEVYYDENFRRIFDRIPKLNNYVLLEFGSNEDIVEILRDLTIDGYKIVLAHAERYNLTISDVEEIIKLGVLIQVNATSVLKNKFVNELLKKNLVHFVASDMHNLHSRKSFMAKAYQYLAKKYKEDYTKALFVENAQKFLKI